MESPVTDDAIFFDENFQNMKVADLKKELKARGLPVSGTKIELLGRLQEAVAPKEDKEFESHKLDDSQDSEDDVLIKLDADVNAYARMDNKSEDEILDNLPDAALSSLLQPASEAANETKPLKKRIITSSSNGTSASEKKLTLNRNSSFVTPTKPTVESDLTSLPKTEDSQAVLKKTTVNLTANEKLALRAKRFNVDSVSTSPVVLGTGVSKSNTQLGGSTKGPEMDVLKKRAERFGENVSTVMKQIEEKEKVLKRKVKFGASLSLTADVSERKKQRAERFKL